MANYKSGLDATERALLDKVIADATPVLDKLGSYSVFKLDYREGFVVLGEGDLGARRGEKIWTAFRRHFMDEGWDVPVVDRGALGHEIFIRRKVLL